MHHSRQLALPLPLSAASAFLPGAANAAALAWLAQPHAWPNLRLAVWGEPGCGKTHLLRMFAARSPTRFLQGETIRRLMPLPEAGTVAIDDADETPEPTALLHLVNAASEQKIPVLLTGRLPPARWSHHWSAPLADLSSRLRATSAVELLGPEDSLLQAMLAASIAARQLVVPEAAQAYLLARLPRNGTAMHEAAARLDRIALASGKKVSLAMATLVVAQMGSEPPASQPQGWGQ